MLTTTSEYKTEISKTGRHFLNKIIINETEYTGIKNFSYHGGTNSSDHISIGDAVSAYIEFTLTDCPSKMLTGQKATAYIGLKLSDSVEWIKMGIFHLDKPKRNGNYLDITAYDNFSLMEKGFYSDLSGNQKIVDILDEQCNKIGISFVGGADDVYYDVDLLKGSTVREAVAILAAYCGKNAIINRDGNLKFVWFDDIGVTLTDDYYNDTIEFDEEDTVIKRLDCTNETETLSIGTGIGIVFSCPGMTQERLNVLYNRINGFTYRAVSFDWQRARPDIEAGDMINLTIQGNNCSVPLMDFIVSCDGGCYGSIESKGKTQEEQDHEFTSPSEARYNFVYEEVISVKKVMADTIDAWQGNFESIETNFLTVNQKITALEGEFEKINVDELTARIATIEQAYISKVEAAELYATKAEIGVLDADVANIKTLLAGSTTTGDLQSIVINSKNATIENGTIKNAMIESLAFDKITGVDINTTKLTVHSADGKSIWRDNTIQISDSTRVRVQIGKDASNDYNIYIWDKTGKLMFDATGVTADGIQRPIIRDDMVSDTANINGKKINIQSVVKEINNGTEKIKSSSVLYDPTGQTLNIAFNELITTVDGIDERVESNTTQISIANGEINTLISKTTQMQTDLSSAQGNITDLSTKYNQMKQTVDSYGVTIGEHTSQITSVRNDLDNLEVGGRNILVNSDFLRETYGWVIESTTMTYKVVDDDKVGKYLSLKSTAAGNVNGNRIYQINFANGDTGHIANQVYSLSFYAKTTSTTAVGIHAGWVSGLKTLSISGTTWKRYAVTYTTTGTGSMTIYIDKANTELHIAQIKLEKGNKATDWTPAPEDIESSITEVSDKQSSMQLDLDGFKTSVSNTYATKTQLNTVDGKFANYSTTTQMNTAINQSASNIKLEASKTYATKNELTGKVDTDKVVSAINVSPEEIKIQSSKITLEGIVTANSRFKILTDGSMEAVNGKFSGTITASNGKIAGWNIDTMNIYKETESDGYVYRSQVTCSTALSTGVVFGISRIKDNNREWMFYVAPDGRLYATKASIVGSITATSGRIGKFNIYSDFLMAGTGSTAAGMSGNQAFWAGGEISNEAPFRVSYDGKLVATNATITGIINGGSITSNTKINVTTDATIGNNLYVGQDQSVGSSRVKYVYFSNNTYLRKTLTSNYEYLHVVGSDNVSLAAGYHKSSVHAGISVVTADNIPSVNIYTNDGTSGIKPSVSLNNKDVNIYSSYAVRMTNGTSKQISFWSGSGTFGGYFTPASPDNADKITLGTEDYRWYRLYSQLGVYTPSDIRKKTNIREYDKRFEDMYMDLKPIIYDFKNDIGNSHCGLIAQWTKDAMNKHGVNDAEFGVYEYNAESDSYGIIYEELTSLNMYMIQKTIKRVNTHDKEIAELKSEIARLQSKLEAYVNGTLEIKRA
jgi:hypothetical protein|nr:MAG TPA: Neck appendage protein [Caudoviricetes sp.]